MAQRKPAPSPSHLEPGPVHPPVTMPKPPKTSTSGRTNAKAGVPPQLLHPAKADLDAAYRMIADEAAKHHLNLDPCKHATAAQLLADIVTHAYARHEVEPRGWLRFGLAEVTLSAVLYGPDTAHLADEPHSGVTGGSGVLRSG